MGADTKGANQQLLLLQLLSPRTSAKINSMHAWEMSVLVASAVMPVLLLSYVAVLPAGNHGLVHAHTRCCQCPQLLLLWLSFAVLGLCVGPSHRA